MAQLEKIHMHPEYQRIEKDYIKSQQKIGEAMAVLEAVHIDKTIKDKIVNTLAAR